MRKKILENKGENGKENKNEMVVETEESIPRSPNATLGEINKTLTKKPNKARLSLDTIFLKHQRMVCH